MNILAFDVAMGPIRIVLKTKEKIFAYTENESNKHMAESILQHIDELLKQANITIKEIDVIGVGVGPGSFTGIRIAIATAKGFLCANARIKLCAFTSFEALAYTIEENQPYVAVIKAFSNLFYIYDSKTQSMLCDSLQALQKQTQPTTLVTDEGTKDSLQNISYSIVVSKGDILSVVEQKIRLKEFCGLNEISPCYVRASQAELQRAQKESE